MDSFLLNQIVVAMLWLAVLVGIAGAVPPVPNPRAVHLLADRAGS
jgi:hypothetical protein